LFFAELLQAGCLSSVFCRQKTRIKVLKDMSGSLLVTIKMRETKMDNTSVMLTSWTRF